MVVLLTAVWTGGVRCMKTKVVDKGRTKERRGREENGTEKE